MQNLTPPLFSLDVELAPAIEAGLAPQGSRRISPIVGGLFSGSRLRRTVLPRGPIGTSSVRIELSCNASNKK
ncbi:DUF3237 family protein [Sulfuritalea sp.]|uniref:DUF3237 family protein n=1 Tax=Sulfuritalea sp. TaxID=2480090 RepID=UPI001AC78333|nr:DUF3237 family protein [Sulfuritalea sp.]